MRKQVARSRRRIFRSLSSSFPYGCWRRARRFVAFLLCIPLALGLHSCWSQRELNELAIVLGVGLDAGSEPDTLTLTSQVVKVSELGSGATQGGRSGEKAFVNLTDTGKSVLSTVRNITHMQNRRLYFSHNKVLILSSDLAKLDIAEGMDVFIRDYEARMNVYMLISRGRASEILEEESDLEKIPAMHIYGMMENQRINSETAVVTLRDFAIATLSGSTAPVAPMIEVYESEEKKKVKLDGTAVFKQGKMIGELDKAQTRGLMWVTGKARSGAMTVDTQWGQVILEILHSKSSLKAVKAQHGTIRMELRVDEDVVVQSNETTEDMTRPENIAILKEHVKKEINADIEKALRQARSLSADIFGFGEAIRREYPEEWEKMKENWDMVFSEIGLDVQVEVELRSTGGLSKPVVPGGAQ